jgi:hypothetical protein
VKRYHWGFDDPAKATGSEEEVFAVFRRVRDEIGKVFGAYAAGINLGNAAGSMDPFSPALSPRSALCRESAWGRFKSSLEAQRLTDHTNFDGSILNGPCNWHSAFFSATFCAGHCHFSGQKAPLNFFKGLVGRRGIT